MPMILSDSTTKHVPDAYAPFWTWRFMELHLWGVPKAIRINWKNPQFPTRIEFPSGGTIETDGRKQQVPMVMLSLSREQIILLHEMTGEAIKMWAEKGKIQA